MRIGPLLVIAWLVLIPGTALADGQRCFDGWCPPAETNNVPEPETLALLGVGAAALFIARRRNKK